MNNQEIEKEVRKNIEAYKELFKTVGYDKPRKITGNYKDNPILSGLIYALFGAVVGCLFFWGI